MKIINYCSQLNDKGSYVTMPPKEKAFESFHDHKKAHPIPVVLYADTECNPSH